MTRKAAHGASRWRRGLPALLAVGIGTACVPDTGRSDETIDALRAILEAEDGRPSEGRQLRALLDATEVDDPSLRRVAVRALGRLENPTLSPAIARRLDDPDARVRLAAAEALAQAVHRVDGSAVLDALLPRVQSEADPEVRGMLARSVGRLQLDEAGRRRAVGALVELAGTVTETPDETLEGVALGFESLVRRSDEEGLDRQASDLLVSLMRRNPGELGGPAAGPAGRIRSLAASALGQARRLSYELIRDALDDPEPEVRRVVLGHLNAVPPTRRDSLVLRALADTSDRVVIAAVAHLAALPRSEPRCEQLTAAAGPEVSAPIRVVALAALASPCPAFTAQRSALIATVAELRQDGAPWQPSARALLSLAMLDAEAASDRLSPFADHGSPFVRAWAARAAAEAQDTSALSRLTLDPSPNVRTEAVGGLFALQGHGVDDLLVEQLETSDPQLLLTVATLLQGAPDGGRTARAALEAFERISRAERETWRDPRIALLVRVRELGDASLSDRLAPFLSDYDPLVAEAVASTLSEWTGQAQEARPEPLPRARVPTGAELPTLERSTLTLHMQGGGVMVVDLFADQATTNVVRLVRLASEGYYDGLTLHRWAPNFVVQGGSPGANEYQGDGPYTRDEVGGVPHWRGTIGLSTRGRDTGDGQIFINLVDNPRLNYDYTVMGRLLEGYDVLDGILEGAVIERAVVTSGRRPS